MIEAKNYSYSLLIKNNAGDENYSHQGKLFTLDIGDATKGTVFTIDTDAVEGIFTSDSKLDVRIVIRNLKEEAKDDDSESGVSEGED